MIEMSSSPSAYCGQVDADDTVAPSGLLFRCGLKAVEPLGNANVGKARLRERRDKLCFQQSTGDSTGPKVDILSCVFRQLNAKHDVCDLQSTTWFQDAADLGDCRSLLWHQIQDTV